MQRLMPTTGCVLATWAAMTAPATADNPPPPPATLAISPAEFTLRGPQASQRLLVSGAYAGGSEADLSPLSKFESTRPVVAAVDSRGVVTPRGAGVAEIVASYEGRSARTRVTVTKRHALEGVDFRTDVIAALSHAGCNQGACHGSPQGKNGFRLSLRGYDPDLDLFALTRESGGRRTDPEAPADSLVIRKGSGLVPHQGGTLFRTGDPAYRHLLAWVAGGRRDDGPSRVLRRLEVSPDHRLLHTKVPAQQIVARAHFRLAGLRGLLADEEVCDVTDLAVFGVNGTAPATVSSEGLVRFSGTGEASVLVRYLDRIVSARLTYVRHDPAYRPTFPAPANYVDKHVFAKQRALQLNPAPICSDAEFLRRASLDLTGGLPAPEEARAFLDSTDPDRRARLIDRLIQTDGYANFWALKWADVLRGSPATISERGVHSFHRYLVRSVAEDRPFDAFARELLTAQGNTLHKPAANFYRVARTPEEAAEGFAQLFLGVRVQCARCHNHPFEALTQGDYYGLAAYFAQVRSKGTRFMLDDEVVYIAPEGQVQNPRTHAPQAPSAFGTDPGPLAPDDDRRARLADWLTRPDNPYFARSVVNRVWYHVLGRGIVDPVDDFRATNPPSNPELLDALSADFVRSGYRLRPVLRTILNSRTYQLAGTEGTTPSAFAAPADRYFTRAAVRMLGAEQVLDGVSQATGVPESFKGYPPGTKAVELAEGGINHPFLVAFSKPARDASCECAREDDPTLPEMLHLLNNAGVLDKVRSPASRLGRWLAADRPTAEGIELVYLATLTRRPTPAEGGLINRHLARVGREKGLQDLQYALLNSNEFLLRH